MLFEAQGELMPMWLCLTDEGKILPITGVMPDLEHRDAFAAGLQAIFKDQNVVMYVAMLESWMMQAPSDDPEAVAYLHGIKRVSDHPDRKEVIMVQAESHDGQAMGGLYDISRVEGKPILGEFKKTDGLATGRFCDLLASPRQH